MGEILMRQSSVGTTRYPYSGILTFVRDLSAKIPYRALVGT